MANYSQKVIKTMELYRSYIALPVQINACHTLLSANACIASCYHFLFVCILLDLFFCVCSVVLFMIHSSCPGQCRLTHCAL